MQVTGKLVKKLELETGTSKAGKEWQKQSIVIDTGEEFNNIVCISAFGEKVLMCNVYSREYKGKYYHNIEGWKFAQGVKAEEMVTPDDLPF